MLVAEGLVIQDHQIVQGMMTLEDIAEGFINEMVDRSLLTVSKKRSDGSTKTCHIHKNVRGYSMKKGMEDKFWSLVTSSLPDYYYPRGSPYKIRRLVLDYDNHPEGKPVGQVHASNLRSLVLSGFDNDPRTVSGVPFVFHEDDFKLLKLLDLLYVSIDFPSKIGTLLHLKYLALWSEVSHLPPSFTNLFNLETLVLHSRKTVVLPYDIWKMVKLRHICNKIGLFHFETTPNSRPLDGSFPLLENLQTLSQLCGCKSCIQMLARTPKIRKLALRGNFISESGCLMFPDLDFLMQLEVLRFTNTSTRSRSVVDFINPKLPCSVKRLTLQSTFLKWEDISGLGSLDNLEVLKLLDDACVGSDWDTHELEFPQLKYLKLKSLDVVKWVDHDMQFQSLEVLVLEDCLNAKIIPFGLARLPRLGLIEVKRCNKSVEKIAKKLVQQHKQQCGDDNLQTVIMPQI